MATLAAEIADDWKDFDGLETVTLRQVRPDGAAEVSLSYEDDDGETQPAALRREITRRESLALGGVGLESETAAWELPVSVVGSGGVKIGDTLTDADGVVWRVQMVNHSTLKTRWRAVCTKQE